MEFKFKIKEIKTIAEGTTAVIFNKPADFEFRAGQFMEWFLSEDAPNDSRGLKREFSIASAPSDDFVEVAFRSGESAFKKSLRNFADGVEVRAEGPFGSFVLPKKADRPLVFLAGGIGITPFRSMVREAELSKSDHEVRLFHFDQSEERQAFFDEWQGEWRKGIETISVIGERVSLELLEKHGVFKREPVFFAAGPPGFVASCWQILNKAGVDELDIRTEEFSGYQ